MFDMEMFRQKIGEMVSISKSIKVEINDILDFPAIAFNSDRIIAVDGSYCIIYSVSNVELYLIKIASLITNQRNVQIDNEIVSYILAENQLIDDDPVVKDIIKLSGRIIDQISNLMEIKERSKVINLIDSTKYKPDSHDIILIDGSLGFQKKSSKLSELISILNRPNDNVSIVAISKDSALSTIHIPDHDEFVLDANVSPDKIGMFKTTKPNTYFVKFARRAKFFRCDVISKKEPGQLFSVIKECCHPILGYPMQLIEAHREAKSIRGEMKAHYEYELFQILEELHSTHSFNQDSFSNDKGERSSFHDLLDEITK